ncbi:MAG: outer membrane beta-barrel protein [Erythrobacter sp.]
MLNSKTPLLATISAAVFAVTLPQVAQAQDGDFELDSGPYITATVGVTSPSDETFEGVQAPTGTSPGVAGAPASVAAEFDEGFTFAGAVGYQIPKRIFGVFQPSIELEYSNAISDVSNGAFNGGNQTFDGDIDVNTFTINYRSELRLKENQTVVPFWGGGIGIADVDANITYFPNNGVVTAPTFAVQGSDTALVLHSNVGLSVRLSDNVDLEGRARYQRTSDLDLERRFIADNSGSVNADVSGNYETVSGLLGLRYRF